MKHIADEIINSFSRQELREFRYFLGPATNGTDQREDLKFIDIVRKGSNTDQKNVNAEHQTRKRIKKQLEQFTLLENLRHDSFSRIHALMETAKYLFRKNLHKQAWEYLSRAEQMAIQAEEYQLLDYNYDIQISYSYNVATHPPEGFSVPELLGKWEDNRELAEADSNANAALALLIHELREQFSKQLSVDIGELMSGILKKYGLHENPYDNKLRIYCKIVNLVCRVLREKRDYRTLKEYAIDCYGTLEKKKGLEKLPAEFVIDLLDAICVAALRSKDYLSCEKYTRLYEVYARKMQAHPGEYSYYDFIPAVGVCDLCLCTNRPDEARKVMLEARLKYADYAGSTRISFLLRINLLAVHFSFGEYEQCIRVYSEIRSLNEKEILKEPGFRLELILFTDIYGILFHYEEDDTEYASYLLEKLKRKYSALLKHPDSKREKFFLKIVEQMINQQGYIRTKKFHTECLQFTEMKEFIAGDFEYISMNAWLLSKVNGRKYYESFLELVS